MEHHLFEGQTIKQVQELLRLANEQTKRHKDCKCFYCDPKLEMVDIPLPDVWTVRLPAKEECYHGILNWVTGREIERKEQNGTWDSL